MTDQALDILKLVLLGLLYLFFARVLWAVWSEVRSANSRATAVHVPPPPLVDDGAATLAAPAPASRRERRRGRPAKGRGGRVARLVVVEPKERRGATFPLGAEITVGRDPGSTIMIEGDTFVSSTHLRIYDVEGQAMVEDLGSTNGSFHNGNRLVGARLLHPGDRIQVGYTVLEAQ
jgi:FHA domain